MEFKLQEISPGTVAVIDDRLASNAGAIILDDFIVAIDATMRPDTSRMFRTMLEKEYQRPVKYLCVTHYHGDHVFGLKSFKDIVIFASVPIAGNIERRLNTDWTPAGFAEMRKEDPSMAEWVDDVELIIPPLLFHDKIEIRNNRKTVEFYHVGGHTSCTVYAYYPSERILFTGDLIFSGQIPYVGDITCDPEQWIKTLKAFLRLEIDKLIPGHGSIADIGEIKKQIEFLEILKKATFKAIKAGKKHNEIVMPDIYPLHEKDNWMIARNQEQWYNYYREKLGVL